MFFHLAWRGTIGRPSEEPIQVMSLTRPIAPKFSLFPLCAGRLPTSKLRISRNAPLGYSAELRP